MERQFRTPGNTRTLYLERSGQMDIHIKLEGDNPSGSLKDRSASYIVDQAIKNCQLRPGIRLLDASSGSYATALAYYGKHFGYPVTVVVNSKATEATIKHLQMLDAEVIRHGEVTRESREHCQHLMQEHPGRYFFTDQLENALAAEAHAKNTAPEILRDTPNVTWVCASMGSGAALSGLTTYFKRHKTDVGFIASVASAGSRPITGTFHAERDYVSPFIAGLRERRVLNYESPVSYDEAVETTRALVARGYPIGIQGGGLVTAVTKIAAARRLHGTAVLLIGDHNWKYMERL